MELDAQLRQLDINLRGFYLMCRAVVPGMLEQGRGAIVNTSSVTALMTEPHP